MTDLYRRFRLSPFILLSLFVLGSAKVTAQQHFPDSLTSEAQMSIIIASPVEQEIYTVYGHAAFRVYDPSTGVDVTFNYGIFSFDDGFLFKFVKGETDYIVLPIPTPVYMDEYLSRGSAVDELVLNMTSEEKTKAWDYLRWNIRPENVVYRYNFFYDNCATRPLDIYLRATDAKEIVFKEKGKFDLTWRKLINEAEGKQPWLLLGTDLALGSPTDQTINQKEELFLPERMVALLPAAKIARGNGTTDKIVQKVEHYESAILPSDNSSILNRFFTPLTTFTLLLLILCVFMLNDIKKRKRNKFIEVIVLSIIGLGGCILFFLSFISVHPHTYPNFNMFVIHPLHLIIGVPLVLWSNIKGFYYHFVNFVLLLLFCVLAWFLPQHFNTAMVPITGMLLLISGCRIYQYWQEKKNK